MTREELWRLESDNSWLLLETGAGGMGSGIASGTALKVLATVTNGGMSTGTRVIDNTWANLGATTEIESMVPVTCSG